MHKSKFRLTALAIGLYACASLTGCGGDKQEAETQPPVSNSQETPADAPSALPAANTDELREKAATAYRESRLYAPAGDNAIEYYLQVRERTPGDPSVSSTLSDLLPMLVIAVEQSRDRKDYAEA